MFLIDSHCHFDMLNYKTLHKNISEVLDKAYIFNVKLFLSVCTSLLNFNNMVKIVGKNNNILFSCGTHPLHIKDGYDFLKLKKFSTNKNVIAIGETGLDYHYNNDINIKIKQQKIFREHIQISKKVNKPIIIHTRKSIQDILIILVEEQAKECSGIFHCFNDNINIAKKILDLGFYISFSGMITFKNSENIRKTIRYIPLDRLLLETDSPYLTPIPYRGKENQPSYIYNIAKCVALLKNTTLEKIAYTSTKNFFSLFKLKQKYFF